MKARCNNPEHRFYQNYGGRGIKVCDRWQNSFEDFLEDVGLAPSPAHSLDRRDNDGDYEPGNCHWATHQEQADNKRSTVLLTWNGKTQNPAAWSAEVGIPRQMIYDRLHKGWDAERTLTTPPQNCGRRRRSNLAPF